MMYLNLKQGVINLFKHMKRNVFGDLEKGSIRAAFGTENSENLLYIVYLEGGNKALLIVAKVIRENIVMVMAKLKETNRNNVEVWELPLMSIQSYYKNRYKILAGFTSTMNKMYGTVNYREIDCVGRDYSDIDLWFKTHVRHFHINKIIMIM